MSTVTRFISALIFVLSAGAQTAHLTEQLGRTVEYDDPAISPDGTHIAWAQTTAAVAKPVLCVAAVSGGRPVSVRIPGSHKDSNPAWSPDSKTVAFFAEA